MGIKLKEKLALVEALFKLQGAENTTFNASWEPVLGEQASIVNHYNGSTIGLIQNETKVKNEYCFRVLMKVSPLGYDFPKRLNYFIISDEGRSTNFNR
jgi:hypothetical protein